MDAFKNAYLDQDGNLKGITQRELIDDLVSRMKKADWYFSYSDDAAVRNRGAEELAKIDRGLKLLAFSNGGGAQAGQLWEQHTPEKFAMSRYLYRAALLEQEQLLNGDPNPVVTLIKALQERLGKFEIKSGDDRYDIAKELESDFYRLVAYKGREQQAVQLYRSSTYGADDSLPYFFIKYQQFLPMNEKILDHAAGQLKRVGMLDSLTPDLRAAFGKGEPLIQHPYKKEYGQDVVSVTQHWRKSNTTDNHFLNKYDLELLKAGKEQAIKQTIYLTNKPAQENDNKIPNINYTLKEAYNLLSGRPVFKDLVNNQGDNYKAWVQLDLTQQFPSGNFKTKMYNENYGFKLEDVLRRYPILELLREMYKERLFESLQRGNLQKVHLIGNDKKQEPVLATPSITNGSLNLYELDGKRIPLETQVQKNWITKEFAQEQKQRFSQKNRDQQQKQDGQQAQKGQRMSRSMKKRE